MAELPINILIVIILAILVLVALIGLYLGVWGPGAGGIETESAKNNACRTLISAGCDISTDNIKTPNFDANKDGTIDSYDNLQTLCEKSYGVALGEEEECKKLCGCPGG